MRWQISFTKEAEKFLAKNQTSRDDVDELVLAMLKRLQGENVNVDIKKLKGEWEGFYRIRKGDLRVIAALNFESHVVFVDRIDWRGGVYGR